MRDFGSEARPLRPSKCGKLVACPMSVFLDDGEDGGGPAAQTGNLVHSAVAAFHTHKDVEAGLAALEAARQQFPKGNPDAARKNFRAYAADKTNDHKFVTHVEHQVRLDLAPAPDDPTGKPIVVIGTLDQVRLDFTDDRGNYYPGHSVWDVKNGTRLDASESLDEHLIQQAVYVLGARQTLGFDVKPGGLILTPAYDKPRGRRFIPWKLSVRQCMLFCAPIVNAVALIRSGVATFKSSPDSCRYCQVRPFTNCASMYFGLYGDRGRSEADVQEQHEADDAGPDPDLDPGSPDDGDRQAG